MGNNTKHGVLSKEDIVKFGIIPEDDLDNQSLQTCSYDLRLSDRHYLFDDKGNLTGVFLGDDPALLLEANAGVEDKDYLLDFPKGETKKLRIPPFGSAIIELKEVVDTYKVAKDHNCLVVGRFDLKLSSIYKGLISQQATQVEPCYRGRLYCFVHNLTANDIVFTKDERIATIEFLFAGDGLETRKVKEIVKETEERNEKKYKERYVFEGQGIKDVRFLRKTRALPLECGLAPINRKVNNNIDAEIQRYMEKDSTINWYTERVGKRIDETQGIVKLVLSLVVAIVSLLGVSFVTDVTTQLRYFEEQLAFYGQVLDGEKTLNSDLLAAIEAHTHSFDAVRESLFQYTIIAVVAISSIIFIYYFFISESFWVRMRNRLTGKNEYLKLWIETWQERIMAFRKYVAANKDRKEKKRKKRDDVVEKKKREKEERKKGRKTRK